MRARLHRTSSHQPRPADAEPRLRLVREEAPAASEDEFAEERRMRDAGGPHDAATYHCHCGYVFEAPVTTSVRCPHCDSGQAW
jgi:predicted Zn-ribbon and HTH transcriptional regulator